MWTRSCAGSLRTRTASFTLADTLLSNWCSGRVLNYRTNSSSATGRGHGRAPDAGRRPAAQRHDVRTGPTHQDRSYFPAARRVRNTDGLGPASNTAQPWRHDMRVAPASVGRFLDIGGRDSEREVNGFGETPSVTKVWKLSTLLRRGLLEVHPTTCDVPRRRRPDLSRRPARSSGTDAKRISDGCS